MSSLTKRVDALEQANGIEGKAFLWVTHATDGGFVYNGQFYADAAALLSALGLEPDGAFVFGRETDHTAAELLAAAEERAKNPLPEISIDELGEYGRQLVEGQGVSPAVAKHLEALRA
jgi:hypothetical protein